MADTIRTRAALQVLLADNVAGDISAQDIRDFLVSCVLRNSGSGADQYIIKPHTGDSTTFFQISDFDGGTPVLNVDTTNEWVGIGTAAPENALHLSTLALGEGIKLQRAGGGQALDQAWGLTVGIGGVDDRYFSIYDHARTGGGSAGHRLVIADETGYVGIGDTQPTCLLDVNADSIRIRTAQSPASNGTGIQGEIAWDATYLYGCINTNTWGRIAWETGY